MVNHFIEVYWQLWIGDKIKMSNDCKIVVDTNEFQQKVLDYISSDDIDKMISNTVFADKPECKSAIIHGMLIASMLTSACELMYVREYKEEEKCMLSASEAKAKTQNNINDGVTAELNEINILIENYIMAGKFSFSKDGSLEPETRRKLEELGYDVKTGMQKNESYYSISWR